MTWQGTSGSRHSQKHWNYSFAKFKSSHKKIYVMFCNYWRSINDVIWKVLSPVLVMQCVASELNLLKHWKTIFAKYRKTLKESEICYYFFLSLLWYAFRPPYFPIFLLYGCIIEQVNSVAVTVVSICTVRG